MDFRIADTRADSSQPNMGLTTWEGARIRKTDVGIAKNYLNEEELRALNKSGRAVFDFCRRPGNAAHCHDHAGLDRQTGRLFDTERPRDSARRWQGVGELSKSHAEQEFDKFRVLDDRDFASPAQRFH